MSGTGQIHWRAKGSLRDMEKRRQLEGSLCLAIARTDTVRGHANPEGAMTNLYAQSPLRLRTPRSVPEPMI